MADDTIERLEGEVATIEDVQHAHALDVVKEPAPGATVIGVIQKALSRVPEGRVPDVVTKCYGLDEVEVKTEGTPDIASHTANELLVEVASGDIVVCRKGEDLRLAVQAIVRRRMNDLLAVADKGRTQKRRLIMGGISSYDRRVCSGKGRGATRRADLCDALCRSGREFARKPRR